MKFLAKMLKSLSLVMFIVMFVRFESINYNHTSFYRGKA